MTALALVWLAVLALAPVCWSQWATLAAEDTRDAQRARDEWIEFVVRGLAPPARWAQQTEHAWTSW